MIWKRQSRVQRVLFLFTFYTHYGHPPDWSCVSRPVDMQTNGSSASQCSNVNMNGAGALGPATIRAKCQPRSCVEENSGGFVADETCTFRPGSEKYTHSFFSPYALSGLHSHVGNLSSLKESTTRIESTSHSMSSDSFKNKMHQTNLLYCCFRTTETSSKTFFNVAFLCVDWVEWRGEGW